MPETIGTQARRLRRKKFSSASELAEEMYSILEADRDPTTGPIAINFRDDNMDNLIATATAKETLGLALVDLDAPTTDLMILADAIDGKDLTNGQYLKTVTQPIRHRSFVLGKVVTNSGGGTHVIDLYPNGVNGDTITVNNAVERNGNEVDADTWVSVYRYLELDQITRLFQRKDDGSTIAKTTELKLTYQEHSFTGEPTALQVEFLMTLENGAAVNYSSTTVLSWKPNTTGVLGAGGWNGLTNGPSLQLYINGSDDPQLDADFFGTDTDSNTWTDLDDFKDETSASWPSSGDYHVGVENLGGGAADYWIKARYIA